MKMNRHVEVHEGAVLKIDEKPVPEIAANEALVKVSFSGLCGSDVPRIFDNGAHFYPLTLGHEFSGEVIQVGSDVKKVAVGNKISCAPLVPCMKCADCEDGNYSLCKHYSFVGSRRQGGNAEYVAVPEVSCFVLPDDVSMQEGAFFEPVTVGLHPMVMNGGCEDQNVVVIGAGTIGLLTLQCAKALGAKSVTVIDIADDKLATAKHLGADYIYNSTKEADIEALMENLDITRNQLIIELAGVPATFKLALKIAGPRAHIYLVGTIHRDFDIAYKEYEQILRKEATITGSWMNYSKYYPGKEWELAAQLFGQGKINTEILLDGIYDAQQYIDRIASLPKDPMRGKVMLSWES
ncbi:galactitol-1-phosphate 5-dehydrogenase [Vibrio sp. HA2012]|uniref:alcohol dehydrogenase catalytic domain-containing protein n=1 Tax=Vibrio sp. HA2012 TaxID=1971595 RepID=UPI000C2B95E8|nr:alcohol dehydrogenase catalytic domain-containing protein [Vibrio sp. HA2012]PJC86793.1 galactitol-1-phosphate 5-dehydrogenase [Vibrio sp. HA2012]